MKRVAVVMADGFEEIEAITTIDILRRASIGVDVVGLYGSSLTGAHGITIECDDKFDYYSDLDYDGVVMVGGMANANELANNDDVLKLLREYNGKGKLVAGICATPSVVFTKAHIVDGVNMTCYPSRDLIDNCKGACYIDNVCVVSNNIITSQSPATAFEFAISIVEYFGIDYNSLIISLQGK